MVKLHLELEGEVDEVVRVLAPPRRRGQRRRRGSGWAAPCPNGGESIGCGHCSGAGDSGNFCNVGARRWTQELAADFTASLDAAARRVMFQVWRAGERGSHRDVLCQRADLTPVELRSLLIRMGHALGRFQRERVLALPRPVAANSPLQSYFIDPDFAAVAASQMFGERMPDQLA